jgi:hypothetical protein
MRSAVDQRAEGQAEFVLGGGHFVVMLVAGQAHFEHGRDHFAAHVDAAVDRGDREVAALGARTVAQVAGLRTRGSCWSAVRSSSSLKPLCCSRRRTHVVEHEEFGFGADIDGVADAGRLHDRLRRAWRSSADRAIELAGRPARRCRRQMIIIGCGENGSM